MGCLGELILLLESWGLLLWRNKLEVHSFSAGSTFLALFSFASGVGTERSVTETKHCRLSVLLPLTTNTCLYMNVSKHILVSKYMHIETGISGRRE
jgi:hypothetical protein